MEGGNWSVDTSITREQPIITGDGERAGTRAILGLGVRLPVARWRLRCRGARRWAPLRPGQGPAAPGLAQGPGGPRPAGPLDGAGPGDRSSSVVAASPMERLGMAGS